MSHMSQAAGAGVQDQLRQGERVVSNFGPYYATSDRVLLYFESRAGTVVRELSYSQLESIEEVKRGNPRLMTLGTAMALGGFLATAAWGIVIPLLGLIIGIPVVIYGGIGRPAYYQFHGRGVSAQDMPLWRVRHRGAGSLISSIRTITGESLRS